jgi:hypothetical protein
METVSESGVALTQFSQVANSRFLFLFHCCSPVSDSNVNIIIHLHHHPSSSSIIIIHHHHPSSSSIFIIYLHHLSSSYIIHHTSPTIIHHNHPSSSSITHHPSAVHSRLNPRPI